MDHPSQQMQPVHGRVQGDVVVVTAVMSGFPGKDACKAVLPMAEKASRTLH
jgi:hypothetical protein